MATAGKRQQSEQATQTGQPVDAQGRVIAASELAERHQRTSKHRAPRQNVRPPQRKSRSRTAGKPEQRELPLRSSWSPLSWLSPDNFSSGLIRTIFALVSASVILVILVIVYYYFAGSSFFALHEVDVQGNSLLTRDEIEATVRGVVKSGVLRADLNKIREELLNKEVIKDAQITRLLPDMLRVTIVEREPYAQARRSDGNVACVDRDGYMFNCKFKTKLVMPLISGLAETGERAGEINRQRLATYQKFMADLDGSQPALSSRIDEVVFDDVQGVRVILANERTAVFLGREDFRMRLNAALDVLDAIRRKDAEALNVLRIGDAEKLLSGAKISYLNATTPKRVVVGLNE